MAGGHFITKSVWVVKDGLGVLIICLVSRTWTWGLMVFSNLIITAFCIYPYFDPPSHTSGCVVLAVYQLLFLLAGIAHVRCSITDPGVVPRLQSINDDLEVKICSECEQLKPPRAHHCATCMRCVFKVRPPQYDHHCPLLTTA
jgi:palmitoyltransferase